MSEDWWKVLLDGSVGAVIGGVATFLAAFVVLSRQLKADREARAIEYARQNAITLVQLMGELVWTLMQIPHEEELLKRLELTEQAVRHMDSAIAISYAINEHVEESFAPVSDSLTAVREAIGDAVRSGSDADMIDAVNKAVDIATICRSAAAGSIAVSE